MHVQAGPHNHAGTVSRCLALSKDETTASCLEFWGSTFAAYRGRQAFVSERALKTAPKTRDVSVRG